MIIAPSRSSVQLLASRVVLAQSHWKSKTGTRSFNNKAAHTKHSPHVGYKGPFISPLLSAGFSLTTSLFSPINITQFGTRAMSSMARKYAVQEKQRIYVSSPGQLISPFLPATNPPSLFSAKGWAVRYKAARNILISTISSQQIKSKLKPLNEKFSSRSFRNTAKDLYNSINEAIAAGDVGKLRGLLTESMYTTVAKEVGLKQRAHGSKPVNLSWSADLDAPKVVCVRFTRVSAEKLEDFGQVTVFFQGKQTVNVNDVTGKVLSSTTSNVSEYWTFERHLQKYGSWRLCAKPTHTTVENLGW